MSRTVRPIADARPCGAFGCPEHALATAECCFQHEALIAEFVGWLDDSPAILHGRPNDPALSFDYARFVWACLVLGEYDASAETG